MYNVLIIDFRKIKQDFFFQNFFFIINKTYNIL